MSALNDEYYPNVCKAVGAHEVVAYEQTPVMWSCDLLFVLLIARCFNSKRFSFITVAKRVEIMRTHH